MVLLPATHAALLAQAGVAYAILKVTHYFRRRVLEDPDRSNITVEMCERIVAAAA